jgi:hypothetical protein
MTVAAVRFQGLDKGFPRGRVAALGGKDHLLGHQVGKDAEILMAFAHAHFIDAHAADVAKVGLRVGAIHVLKEHPPQPHIAGPGHLSHFGHGHLADQQQRESFELLGEVNAQSFPGRAHPKDMAALAAFAARQPAGDLTVMLEDIETAPRQRFGMVVASDQPAVLGTTG